MEEDGPLAFISQLSSAPAEIKRYLVQIEAVDERCRECHQDVQYFHHQIWEVLTEFEWVCVVAKRQSAYMKYLHDSKGEPDLEQVTALVVGVPERLNEWEQLQHQKRVLADKLYDYVEARVDMVDSEKRAAEEQIAVLEARLGLAATGTDAAVRGSSAAQGIGTAGAGRPTTRGGGAPAAAVAPANVPPHFVQYEFKLPGRAPFVEWVDPNEPLYCTCRQPSQGEMIGCENDDCRYEWFHYACVGVTEADAREAWYCPECRAAGFGRQANRRGRTS